MHIGVDPGMGGGIAAIDDDGNVRSLHKMPATEQDLLELLRSLSGRAILERVHSMPGQGVASTFKFGQCYGALRMGLAAAGIPFDEITPASWQRVLGCLSKGDKNVTKRRAQELFPGVKITHATADALLLAEYGRRANREVAAAPLPPRLKTTIF